MKIRLSVGNDLFRPLREDGCYYIDKTGLISELVKGNADNKVTLITRPRRFGKTLNMSMLNSFFSINEDSTELFKGLKISEDTETVSEWMNSYPTVFISFKDVMGRTYEIALNMLRTVISDFCIQNKYLEGNEKADGNDKELLARLRSKDSSEQDIIDSVYCISKAMYDVFGKPAIILIDEYDVPMSYANEYGYHNEMLDVIRAMFSKALKTNPYLKFAVITGCLRIAKESIFTGTNNFVSYSVTDSAFSEYFGFTEREVNKLLDDAGASDKADTVKEWYDGYRFGKTDVYCPWDVINYVSALFRDKDAKPLNYWENTSHNSIIRKFVDHKEFGINRKFETLLNGGTIRQKVSDNLTYDMLYRSADNLWSALLMTGYLTPTGDEYPDGSIALKIPNKEVEDIFRNTVVEWFNDNLDKSIQAELMNAFWNRDADTATKLMSKLLFKTISYNDYHENYYHAFLAGIFAGLGYDVESNKEMGLGRSDIIIRDYSEQRAMVIETKHSKSESSLDQDSKKAVRQINEKEYADELDGYELVLKYGIAFYKKKCLIKL